MNKIPTTLKECLSKLKTIYSTELEAFKNYKENRLPMLHFTFGKQIRNNFKLWNEDTKLVKYFIKLGIYHPDDMSMIIITSFHRLLNNKDINLNKQIQFYINFWKKEIYNG